VCSRNIGLASCARNSNGNFLAEKLARNEDLQRFLMASDQSLITTIATRTVC
jgi:hypothetical protein